jgi:hypothetical protein
MPLLERADYDAAVAEAIDALPDWALSALSDDIFRIEQRPRPEGLPAERGMRLVVYREPSIMIARDRHELRRLARTDLARAVVWQLDLGEQHEHELTVGALAG